MPEQTTDYRTFVQNERLSHENFAEAYELYRVADGHEGQGTFKSERKGDALIISRHGNPYELCLVHREAVNGFLTFMRQTYMDGDADPERWYALKIATKRPD